MQQSNWEPVKKIADADLIIISTCSLTQDEDQNSLDYIRYAQEKKSKGAKIIIAGCLPIIVPEKLRQIGDFTTISPTNLEALCDIIQSNIIFDEVKEPNNIMVSYFHKMLFKQVLIVRSKVKGFFTNGFDRKKSSKKLIESIKDCFQYCGLLKSYIDPFLVGKRNNFYYLRISKGCLGTCSYCAKRFATGSLKSKLPVDIIDEFRQGLKRGERDFFLVTEDSGCYGVDIGYTIIDLLEQIFTVGKEHDFRLVISNFNAGWLVKYYKMLEKLIVENQKKIYYLQIPIQSGSNRILELMNRIYKVEDVEKYLLALREKVPAVAITTDIIVGFPGETEHDFDLTRKFMKKFDFEHVDIFAFQDRKNTLAHKMKDKVPQNIIDRRVFELSKIQMPKKNAGDVFKKIAELINDFR